MNAPSAVRSSGFELGQSVNLLHGVRALAPGSAADAEPARVPLRRFEAEFEPETTGRWRPLTVTLHRAGDLMTDLLSPFRVTRSFFDGAEFRVDPSRLTSRTGTTHPSLLTGHDISPDGDGHVLVFERTRLDGRAEHEVTAEPTRRYFDRTWHLMPEWRRHSTRLRPGTPLRDGPHHDARIGAIQAQEYVDAFYEYGTHFVSSVETGDRLIQVVCLEPGRAAQVASHWYRLGEGRPVTGPDAASFRGFLGTDHALHVGPITSMATGNAVGDHSGRVADPLSRSGASLAVFEPDDVDGAATTIGVELTSLARFMEYYRALNFDRVLRGALLQQWGDRVTLPLRRLPSFGRSVARTNRSRASLDDSMGSRSTNRCERVVAIDDGEHTDWTDRRTVLGQWLDAAPISDQASRIRLADDHFEQPGLACQHMAGMIALQNVSDTRHDVVVDGLRFTSTEVDEPRVAVRGALDRLDEHHLIAAIPEISTALQGIELTLAATRPTDRRALDAASFADWLADVLTVDRDTATLRRLRVTARYLGRAEPVLGTRPANGQPSSSHLSTTELDQLASIALNAHRSRRGHLGADTPDQRLPNADPNGLVTDRHAHLLDQARTPRRAELDDAERLVRTTADLVALALRAFLESPSPDTEPSAAETTIGLMHDLVEGQVTDRLEPLLERHAEPAVATALEFASVEASITQTEQQLAELERLAQHVAVMPDDLATIETHLSAVEVHDPRPGAQDDTTELARLLVFRYGELHDAPGRVDTLLAEWRDFRRVRIARNETRRRVCHAVVERWFQSLPALPVDETDAREHEAMALASTLCKIARLELPGALDLLDAPTGTNPIDLATIGHALRHELRQRKDTHRHQATAGVCP